MPLPLESVRHQDVNVLRQRFAARYFRRARQRSRLAVDTTPVGAWFFGYANNGHSFRAIRRFFWTSCTCSLMKRGVVAFTGSTRNSAKAFAWPAAELTSDTWPLCRTRSSSVTVQERCPWLIGSGP